MCQHCGCRNTGFDYTKNFNADNSSKPKMTLTCHTNPAGQTQVKAEFEDGRTQFADYNWWTGSRYKDRYDIIDNTTEDCGGKGSGDVAPPKKEKLTLSCSKSKNNVQAKFEDGKTQFADYDFWMSKADRYDIIDNTTSECRKSSSNLGDGGPAPEPEESETDMGMVGFAIAGGAILIAAFLFGRR